MAAALGLQPDENGRVLSTVTMICVLSMRITQFDGKERQAEPPCLAAIGGDAEGHLEIRVMQKHGFLDIHRPDESRSGGTATKLDAQINSWLQDGSGLTDAWVRINPITACPAVVVMAVASYALPAPSRPLLYCPASDGYAYPAPPCSPKGPAAWMQAGITGMFLSRAFFYRSQM